jgi:dTDP-glucose pyrophosphorylase
MTAVSLDRVMVPVSATVLDVLASMERSGVHAALMVDDDRRLVGLLTDGDCRRAMLSGAELAAAALPHATTTPQTVPPDLGRAAILDLMRALGISAVPVVDSVGRATGMHTLGEVAGVPELPNPVVVMAGGKGTRLGELTRRTPKPLLRVAGRSILEWILLNLVGGGIQDVYVSVNHLADQVEEHLGDGSRLGCRVRYLREDKDRPLGTAGSLSLLRRQLPNLGLPVLVMNGDLMVQFEPEQLLHGHASARAAVTVATRGYQHQVPFGVVEQDERGLISQIREKPTVTMSVNAGVYAVSPEALALVPDEIESTMPQLMQRCLDGGYRVAAWPLASEWIDVGTPGDLARAKEGT